MLFLLPPRSVSCCGHKQSCFSLNSTDFLLNNFPLLKKKKTLVVLKTSSESQDLFEGD